MPGLSSGTGASKQPPLSATPSALRVDPAVITKPILDATDGCKRTLIHHDLDKIRTQLTTKECISEVEGTTNSNYAQLADLQDLVRLLNNQVENREMQ